MRRMHEREDGNGDGSGGPAAHGTGFPARDPARAWARERRTSLALAALFALVAGLTGVDLAVDLGHGIEVRHAITEGLVVLVGLAGASWMLWRLRILADEAQFLGERADALAADLLVSQSALTTSRAESLRWRTEAKDLIHGLGAAIDRQLEDWDLSPAEKEVALLLLKGLSHKEIADIRGTGEATVRQQSAGIYRKTGLGGRHDLAAFFLEDLLGPRETTAGS